MARTSEGQTAQLVEATEEIIKKHPKSAESHRFLSTVLREAGKPVEALTPAINAVELEFRNIEGHQMLIEALRSACKDIEMTTALINGELPHEEDDDEEGSK